MFALKSCGEHYLLFWWISGYNTEFFVGAIPKKCIIKNFEKAKIVFQDN